MGRMVDLATNCYGYYVPQKALDCKEEVCLLITSELLRGDPSRPSMGRICGYEEIASRRTRRRG
ncbi:hypothetical protein K438DRAFT_273127 [Mycena galopus ATCC 62051]|nr:hypothetical protein K438DRAFT_273127 [Mycena galopus ATCC 62051]